MGIVLRCLPALAEDTHFNLSLEATGIWGLMVTWVSGDLLE